MRTIAILPAAAILAGAAVGSSLPHPPFLLASVLIAASVVASIGAYAVDLFSVVGAAASIGFFTGALLLAAHDAREAYRPPLRVVFEALAREERVRAAAEGRRLPEDDEAFAIVEGVLRGDAALSDGGVSLSVDVDRIVRRDGEGPSGRGPQRGGRVGVGDRPSDGLKPVAYAHTRNTTGRENDRRAARRAWERSAQAGIAFSSRAAALAPASPRGALPSHESSATGADVPALEFESPIRGGIVVTVVGSIGAPRVDEWRAGRRVRMPVQLHRPARYLDPGVPDYEAALARRGTTLVGTVKSGALVDIRARGSAIAESLAAGRAVARRAIAAAVGRWSPQSAAIVTAIVIGDRAGLSAPLEQQLQDAGTYHVIAISGGNIAILAGVLLAVFRLAGCLGRTAMLSAAATLVAYAALVGGGPSVDRATLMAVLYFLARAFDHRGAPINGLATAAALLVAADPLSILEPAFLLTVGATLAILLVMPVVSDERRAHDDGSHRTVARAAASGTPHVSAAHDDASAGRAAERAVAAAPRVTVPLRRLRRALFLMFVASAAVEAMLFPVAAVFFSRVTFAGLALNFLAIPLMAVAQLAGMAVVPLALVSTAPAAAVGWLAHVGAAGLVWSAGFVRFAPAIAYRVAAPHWLSIAIYYSAAALSWMVWRRSVRLGGAAAGASSDAGAVAARSVVFRPSRAFAAIHAHAFRRAFSAVAVSAALWILADPRTFWLARGDGRLHATFIDVGQGDSMLVRFPRGSTLLVDAGGLAPSSAFDIGDRVVAPVLREAGVRRLDYVALTHGDPDHIGGAPAILSEFRPREVWEGIPVPRSPALATLRAQTLAAGARWANVYAGDRIDIDGVLVTARHPEHEDWERQKVRNDDSLVLDLRWRDISVLLTGDIGRDVERTLEGAVPPARLRVLKVPHHGSLTSSAAAFVAAMRPTIAVVSAGRSNHFGHPVPEVLDRYESMGAEVFRTDRDGAVRVETDGRAIRVETFNGRRLGIP